MLSHSLFILKESQEFIYERQGFVTFMILFYLNGLLNGALWIYSNYLLIVKDCKTTAPELAFWLAIEVLYGYVELVIYLVTFLAAQFCGKRLVKG